MAFAFGLLAGAPALERLLYPKALSAAHGLAFKLSGLALLVSVLRMLDMAWSLKDLTGSAPDVFLLFQTYAGQVLLLQAGSVLLSLLLLHFSGSTFWSAAWLSAAMACTALAGHVVSASESWRQILVSCTHVLLAQLWLAGVFNLMWRLGQSQQPFAVWRGQLARFSKWALPGMLLMLLTGVLLSSWTVASWPALLATPYGWLLIFKLLFVCAVLVCAWQLRCWLKRTAGTTSTVRHWLSSEISLALAVLILASWLAASVPAAHDTIVWPFGFRWTPVLAWRQDQAGTQISLMWATGLLITGALLFVILRKRQAVWRWLLFMAAVIASLAIALPATSIPAYPTTYMHSPLRLDTASVAAGEALYMPYCADCHGLHGQGDGPFAKLNGIQAANLTEPHVSWHTHGDMFWWLTHGRGKMPGFADVLIEEDRWHLINHLIALSFGYEARSLTGTPALFNPWLPALDFRFKMDNNRFMSLSEWRGLHAVHLIIVNQKTELQRVRDLLQDMKGFPAQLVIVVKPEWVKDLVKGPCEAIIVADENADIARAWSLYRRSFAAPDFLNEDRWVARTEFLIDRYGFVRARWRSDEAPSALSVAELKAMYDSLSLEGEIRSAAIHQHD